MTHYNLLLPELWPKPGYYYHYKHKPDGPINNYAYWIEGIGHHTEEDCRPEDRFMMNYLPLYDAHVYKKGQEVNNRVFDNRPLHMFFTPATKDGIEVPRFVRITDPSVIAELRKIKRDMYPPHPDE